jgi:hypothetical protein
VGVTLAGRTAADVLDESLPAPIFTPDINAIVAAHRRKPPP